MSSISAEELLQSENWHAYRDFQTITLSIQKVGMLKLYEVFFFFWFWLNCIRCIGKLEMLWHGLYQLQLASSLLAHFFVRGATRSRVSTPVVFNYIYISC